MFSIYCEGLPNAVVRGGRYDGVGTVFGRNRPATGFSLELRELLGIAKDAPQNGSKPAPVAAPWQDDPTLRVAVSTLRRQGQPVISLPDAEFREWTGKKLVNQSGDWRIN
jgi:ATP phosphoribosyltransferase regulatory subunit